MKRTPPLRKFVFSMNVGQIDRVRLSFQATAQRLECAIQRHNGSGGTEETAGFLKYCIKAGNRLKNRVLPRRPTFCNRVLDEEVIGCLISGHSLTRYLWLESTTGASINNRH